MIESNDNEHLALYFSLLKDLPQTGHCCKDDKCELFRAVSITVLNAVGKGDLVCGFPQCISMHVSEFLVPFAHCNHSRD